MYCKLYAERVRCTNSFGRGGDSAQSQSTQKAEQSNPNRAITTSYQPTSSCARIRDVHAAHPIAARHCMRMRSCSRAIQTNPSYTPTPTIQLCLASPPKGAAAPVDVDEKRAGILKEARGPKPCRITVVPIELHRANHAQCPCVVLVVGCVAHTSRSARGRRRWARL